MELTKMKDMFFELYGNDKEEIRIFTSPGRVNLIGEHVDYCGGPVLPAALTMKTTIIARKRKDDIIRMRATDLDICVETNISDIDSLKGKLKWGDYQLGVASELLKAGYNIGGRDLLFYDKGTSFMTIPHLTAAAFHPRRQSRFRLRSALLPLRTRRPASTVKLT